MEEDDVKALGELHELEDGTEKSVSQGIPEVSSS